VRSHGSVQTNLGLIYSHSCYNIGMYNWSVDENYLKKFPKKYRLWRLEQMLSYGLDGEKIKRRELLTHWEYLKKRLDPQRRRFLEFLLWNKLS